MKLLLLLLLVGLILLFRNLWLHNRPKTLRGNSVPPDLEALQKDPHSLYPVKLNDKWGYMNRAGQLVIPCQYDDAADFVEGRAAVGYREVEADGGISVVRSRMGFIDTTGRQVIHCRYDETADFSEGLARVKKDEKYGYIDLQGHEVIHPQFDEASWFSEGMAAVKTGDKTGFINPAGYWVLEIPMSRSLRVMNFQEGFAPIYQVVTGRGTHFEEDLGGYIDKQGNWLAEPRFRTVFPFSEGLAAVCGEDYNFSFIDTTGRIALETDFDDTHGFHDGIAIGYRLSADKNTRIWYGIDHSGKVVLPELPYDFVGIFHEGLAGVEKNKQWGFIDRSGREVIHPQFTGVSLFRNGLARMETGSLFGGLQTVYIDQTGKFVWKPE